VWTKTTKGVMREEEEDGSKPKCQAAAKPALLRSNKGKSSIDTADARNYRGSRNSYSKGF